MPALNIFEDDAFGVTSLSVAINEQDSVPGRIGQLGLFREEGITTPSAYIEIEGESLSLVPAAERGAPGDPTNGNKRKAIPVKCVHLPTPGFIPADAVTGVRAFGSETDVQLIQTVVNSRLAKMRRRLDATIEFQRMGAIRGQILDADGATVIVDLLQAFGVQKNTHAMALTTATTDVLSKVIEAKRKSKKKLGNAVATGYRGLCSPGFFDKFVGSDAVKEAWNFYNAQNRSSDLRSGFSFGGVIWEEYDAEVGGHAFIPDGKAQLIPEGVPDMFITNYAPADYVDVVGTIGLPFYAKQELARMGKGVDLEAQSNPISYCSRPASIVELSA